MLYDDYFDLGNHFYRLGRLSEAVENLQRSIDMLAQLLEQQPDQEKLMKRVNAERSWLANVFREMGKPTKAIELNKAAIQLDPNAAGAFNGLAWQLVNHKDQYLRDVDECVRLAERAVALAPDSSIYLNTLGAAYYRAGRYDDAVKTLKKAIQTHWGRPAVEDLLFLAMSEHGRSNHQLARRYFTDAMSWSEWHKAWKPLESWCVSELEVLTREVQDTVGVNPDTSHTQNTLTSITNQKMILLNDEKLLPLARVSDGKPERQKMTQFGPTWSGDHQLWWVARGSLPS